MTAGKKIAKGQKVPVKSKDSDRVIWVSPETLKAEPGKYTPVKSPAPKPEQSKTPKPPAQPGAKKPESKPPAQPNAPKKQPPPVPPQAKKPPAPPKPEGAPTPEAKQPKPEAKKPAQPEHGNHDQQHGGHGNKPMSNKERLDAWKNRFHHLSDSAKSLVEQSPKAVKAFIGNPEFRAHAVKEAQNAIGKAGKASMHRLIDTAKEEVHEFKLAGHAIKKILSGGKMDHHEKHAFQTVALHMGIGIAAAALTAAGPLVAAATFVKGLARHVAAKAAHKSLAKVHMLDELTHVGHGVAHLMEHFASEDQPQQQGLSGEEAMVKLVMICVAKELQDMSDDDIQSALNVMAESEEPQQKMAVSVAKKFAALKH